MLVSRMRKSTDKLAHGSLAMRLNHRLVGEMPSAEVSEQRWQLFKRICTVAHEDPEAVWQICELMGLTSRDLAKLKIYVRRRKITGTK